MPPGHRPQAVDSLAALLGANGTLFAKELPPQASDYFAERVQRHGLWPGLERVMQLIPPGQITEPELVNLFSPDRFEVIYTGAGHIDTRNVFADGEAIRVPAVCALIRPRQAERSTLASAAEAEMHSDPQYLIACRRVVELARESSRVRLAHNVAQTGTSRRLTGRLGRRTCDPTRPECHPAVGSWAPLERAAALEEGDRTELAVVPTRQLGAVHYSNDLGVES